MKFQTVERDSIFTNLDFRTKLLMMVMISIVAFIWESPLANGLLTALVISACLFAGVKWSYIRAILVMMIPFYILLLLTHGFFNVQQVKLLTGKAELTRLFTFPAGWWLIGGTGPSLEGLLYGVNVIFKTLTLTLVIPLGIFTTDTDNVVVGMVRARIPYKIVFIFSSTLRFVPLLFQEIQTIIEAQRLRGLAMEKMSAWRRAQVYARIAVPLILGAMVKSQQLEIVLQSKAFSGNPHRTYLHESILKPADYAAIIVLTIFFTMAVVLYFWQGIGTFSWIIFS